MLGRVCRCDPDDETRCGNDAVVRPEDGGAQPSDSLGTVFFVLYQWL
jgi:hypothetical protein